MSFPRYPAYKHSGVEWLGKVPAHWGIRRIKDVAPIINGYPFDSAQFAPGGGTPLVRIRDIYSRGATEIYWSGEPIPSAVIGDGDLLIGMDGDFNVAWWDGGPALLNQRVCCVRARDPSLQRVLYYLLPIPLARINELTYATTVKHLSLFDVADSRFAEPPPEELRAIATFLDRETAKIDALVAEQGKLIALLQEKRQAVISHAVTKGLDPNVPMKDSGVEWIGEVPAHWTVRPLKHVTAFRSGGTPSKDNPDFWEGSIAWASAKDLKRERLDDTEDHITQAAVDAGAAELVPTGAVLVVVRGMILARTFPVSITTIPLAINQDLKALVSFGDVNPAYLARTLQAAAEESTRRIDEAGHGTKALRMDAWTSMPLPVPPVDEQANIIAFLDRETAKIDALVTEARGAIDLLNERRAALISAAVTGQIDVRELAAAA